MGECLYPETGEKEVLFEELDQGGKVLLRVTKWQHESGVYILELEFSLVLTASGRQLQILRGSSTTP